GEQARALGGIEPREVPAREHRELSDQQQARERHELARAPERAAHEADHGPLPAAPPLDGCTLRTKRWSRLRGATSTKPAKPSRGPGRARLATKVPRRADPKGPSSCTTTPKEATVPGSLSSAHAVTKLPAQDLERARAFYRDKLGLEPVEERAGGLRYLCGP